MKFTAHPAARSGLQTHGVTYCQLAVLGLVLQGAFILKQRSRLQTYKVHVSALTAGFMGCAPVQVADRLVDV